MIALGIKKIFSIRYITILIIVVCSNNSFSQQLPLSSLYMFNQFVVNPAATGSSRYLELRLNSRQQWYTLKGAPQTNNISIHKLLGNKRMGLGISLFSDKFGPESKVGLKLSYSYILPLEVIKSNLAFGLAFHGYQYTMNYSQLEPSQAGDPKLQYQQAQQSTFVPDADFGIYLYNLKYTFGISSNQLIQLPVNFGDANYKDNTMVRHYYIMGSYLFNINKTLDLEPSIFIKATEVTPIQADINIRLWVKQQYWVAISYRTANDIIGILGIKYNSFIFGYAYDFHFGEIRNFQTGSHEIILGYNFGQRFKSNSLLKSIRTF